MIVLEVIASLRTDNLQNEDTLSKLRDVVNTLRSIVMHQDGLASRLKIMQPATIYLSASVDRSVIDQVYQTCSEIWNLTREVAMNRELSKRWFDIGRDFREIELVKKSPISTGLLSVALVARNIIVLRGSIDDMIDELQAVCSIGVSEDRHFTEVPQELLEKLLPYPRGTVRIDFVNGISEANSLVYTISLKVWLKYVADKVSQHVTEASRLGEGIGREAASEIGNQDVARTLDAAYAIHRQAIEVSKIGQNTRTLHSNLRGELEAALEGKAAEPPFAVEVSIPPG